LEEELVLPRPGQSSVSSGLLLVDLIAAIHLFSCRSSTNKSFIYLQNTAKMSDDEERVTMPFKFVTGESAVRPM
jgi:hypothetical protein